jgi:hypothetical protein
MSTLAPLWATISRITEPPEPITSRILSTGILMVSMRGRARRARCARRKTLPISPRMCMRPASLLERHAHDLLGDASDLDVHLQRVMPFSVPPP